MSILDSLPLHCRKCRKVLPSRFTNKDPETCKCIEACSCGWYAKPGKVCGNPETRTCSSRMLYGTYNRKTKRWE